MSQGEGILLDPTRRLPPSPPPPVTALAEHLAATLKAVNVAVVGTVVEGVDGDDLASAAGERGLADRLLDILLWVSFKSRGGVGGRGVVRSGGVG